MASPSSRTSPKSWAAPARRSPSSTATGARYCARDVAGERGGGAAQSGCVEPVRPEDVVGLVSLRRGDRLVAFPRTAQGCLSRSWRAQGLLGRVLVDIR